MSTAAHYPHIKVDSAGQAHVAETGYKVQHLAAEHYHFGWTAEELLRQHPDLRPEQVYAALVYFYDHYEEIIAGLEKSASQVESARQDEVLSRSELLSRKGGT